MSDVLANLQYKTVMISELYCFNLILLRNMYNHIMCIIFLIAAFRFILLEHYTDQKKLQCGYFSV